MYQIKTIVEALSQSVSFDERVNEALKAGWTLSTIQIVQAADGKGRIIVAHLEWKK